jgi:hypothetical protein
MASRIADALCVSCKADLAAKQQAAGKGKARTPKGSASPKVTKVATKASPKAKKAARKPVLESLRDFAARLGNPRKREFAELLLLAYEGGEDLPTSDGSPEQDYVSRKWERYAGATS